MRVINSAGYIASALVLALSVTFAVAGVAGATPSDMGEYKSGLNSNGNSHLGDFGDYDFKGTGSLSSFDDDSDGDKKKVKETLPTQGSYGNHSYTENSVNHDGNHVVPEPGTIILLGGGLIGLSYMRRRYLRG